METEERPGFIRCVHPQKGVGYFRKETAESSSWQLSTGWRPQVVEKIPVEPSVASPDPQSRIEPPAPVKSFKSKVTKTADSI